MAIVAQHLGEGFRRELASMDWECDAGKCSRKPTPTINHKAEHRPDQAWWTARRKGESCKKEHEKKHSAEHDESIGM